MLGLGAAIILATLGAISAPHHGRAIFCSCVLCVVFSALASDVKELRNYCEGILEELLNSDKQKNVVQR